jgi:hypothetical protein
MSVFVRFAILNFAAGAAVGLTFVAVLVVSDVSGLGSLLSAGADATLALVLLFAAVSGIFGLACFATAIGFGSGDGRQ